MEKFRKVLLQLVIIALFGFTACESNKTENESENLNALREDFWKDKANESNNQKAVRLDSAYKTYINNHPTDTNNAQYLFENAKLHLSSLKNTDEAISLLERLYLKYPNSPRAPEALYQKAFLMENELQMHDQARQHYQLLIDKYPNHPFAKEAQITIKYVGKDPEEMLKAITDSAGVKE